MPVQSEPNVIKSVAPRQRLHLNKEKGGRAGCCSMESRAYNKQFIFSSETKQECGPPHGAGKPIRARRQGYEASRVSRSQFQSMSFGGLHTKALSCPPKDQALPFFRPNAMHGHFPSRPACSIRRISQPVQPMYLFVNLKFLPYLATKSVKRLSSSSSSRLSSERALRRYRYSPTGSVVTCILHAPERKPGKTANIDTRARARVCVCFPCYFMACRCASRRRKRAGICTH